MGSPIPLESCRMADAAKNNPGQWKFIGIEGIYQKHLLYFIVYYNINEYNILHEGMNTTCTGVI